MIKRIIKRLKAIKSLINANEYFLGVANQKNTYGELWRGPIIYEYFNNTDRNLFYTFIHDYIENNLRAVSGQFICIRDYKDQVLTISEGQYVDFDKGYIINIYNKYPSTITSDLFKHKIPTEEIFSHFKFISNEHL